MSYSINFYLDKSISEKSQQHIIASRNAEAKRQLQEIIENNQLQIFLYLRFAGRTIKVYTERKCTQKEWNNKSQRVNPRYYKNGTPELNDYLDKLKSGTAKLYERNNNHGVVTYKEDVLSVIDTCNNRDLLRNAPISFEQAFDEFIRIKKQKHTESTLKTYRTTLKHVKAFSEKKRVALRFENINLHFEQRFRGYLLADCGMTNNSISKYVKTLKTFMGYCTEDRNYNSPLNVQYRKFDTTEKEKEVHVLSVDELMNLFYFKFDKKHYEHVRDVFCFLCFTGIRFSDVENLTREDIHEDGIHLLTKKTKQWNLIPLNIFALEILKKYKDCEKPLPVISNQKTNDMLHEIGELVGLTDLVKEVQFIGSEVKITYVPKYKILTTHIGRKTFITNSLILGMQERTVRSISGHKSDVNFRRYVAFANDYKQKAMDETWNEQQIKKMK
ncbi:MAG: site-specific integrase [Bacteroidia bacterium]|nr:site-specific integrase [Bacteroidia bacterium]